MVQMLNARIFITNEHDSDASLLGLLLRIINEQQL